MNPQKIYAMMLWFSFPLAICVFITLFFITAPYGRHQRRGWGPLLPAWLGWLLMELPPPLLFLIWFWLGDAPKTIPMVIFFLMWESHYIHRSFIYPFQRSDRKKAMPLLITLMGMIFNIGNGYINGGYLYSFSGGYLQSWLCTPQMIIGLSIFVSGFGVNRWADHTLQILRDNGKNEYKIPYGGLYRWISSPNYLGEIIEWTGWAIATWSLPGLAFALWTLANLAPRARAHHKWYHQYFPDYPSERKALLPGIW